MALVIGNNIVIKIDGIDYTQYIIDYSESGGEKVINNKKTYGNNYITTITGRNDYKVDLTFKFDDTLSYDTLFNNDDSVSIEVTVGTKKITYNNAYADTSSFILNMSEIATLQVSYNVAPADANTYNKEVL